MRITAGHTFARAYPICRVRSPGELYHGSVCCYYAKPSLVPLDCSQRSFNVRASPGYRFTAPTTCPFIATLLVRCCLPPPQHPPPIRCRFRVQYWFVLNPRTATTRTFGRADAHCWTTKRHNSSLRTTAVAGPAPPPPADRLPPPDCRVRAPLTPHTLPPPSPCGFAAVGWTFKVTRLFRFLRGRFFCYRQLLPPRLHLTPQATLTPAHIRWFTLDSPSFLNIPVFVPRARYYRYDSAFAYGLVHLVVHAPTLYVHCRPVAVMPAAHRLHLPPHGSSRLRGFTHHTYTFLAALRFDYYTPSLWITVHCRHLRSVASGTHFHSVT